MSQPFDDLKFPAPPLPNLRAAADKSELAHWLLAISVGLAAMNGSLVPILQGTRGPGDSGAVWAMFCIGSMGGQAGALAIAAVLGPGTALRRNWFVLPRLVSFAMAWFLGVVISQAIHDRPFPTLKAVLACVLVLPLLFCICQLPLWCFRTFLRWRIESPADATVRPPQLTIAGILAATAAVAMSLALVRLGYQLTEDVREASWWFGVAIAAAFSGGISLLVLPVATALVFRMQSLCAGLLLAGGWIALLIGAYLLVLILNFGRIPWRELHLPLFLAFGFAGTLLGSLALCRVYGYRLLWGRGIQPGASSVLPQP
jgi:hypothetical protein